MKFSIEASLLFCGLLCFGCSAFSCALVGSYSVKWHETHGDSKLLDGEVAILKVGVEPRPVLDGTQATSDIDCLWWHAPSKRGIYLLPFTEEQYRGLGWHDQFASKQLICYWNGLNFLCQNIAKVDFVFNCPPVFEGLNLSYEARGLCSVRRTENETFQKKRVMFPSSMSYFGVVYGSGLFSLRGFKE